MLQSEVVYSEVVIIGAGLSGINMACQLERKLGVTDYVIYDRAPEIGGAWAANKYPGCGVDIPGVLYSLSWFPSTSFTRPFPAQHEILAYIKRLGLSHKVPHRTRLQTEWEGAKWVESSNTWHIFLLDIQTQERFVHEAKILISAVGGYTNPKLPQIAGLEDFEGPVIHTAQWERDYDLKGLNVVVVGNGCSGSQLVPAVIDDVNTVTQFIRGPQHYVPMAVCNDRFTRGLQILFRLPFVLRFLRWVVFWTLETGLSQFWNDSQGRQMRKSRLALNQSYITKNAPEEYWPLLTPDYDLGCKRRIMDKNYISSLHNPKMKLVKDAIGTVGPKTVTTISGDEYQIDFIVLATGFEFTQWQSQTVIGRQGKTLQQHWNSLGGIGAFQTVATNGFPNMFYLLGPNSGSGHTSVLFSMECAVNLVIDLISPIINRRAKSVEVREKAEIKWCDTIQSALSNTVLTQSCSNVSLHN
ncbi:uncharacterized protein N7484_006095 [Penicillium longicatenatum]|uniref:uncharacterized protein n=1 Tax=Penicillium longicatenatum TaxID=1561947 RepID=UPI002548B9D5|nr:uncharacterized protein N7484_006095 [Penicillium longicatenatum]KAJ5643588.1 hypothetical protein N7484_006095 [Penicillium longicatenatum]